jgi:hypothetical protein
MKVIATLPLKDALKKSLSCQSVRVSGVAKPVKLKGLKTFAVHGCRCVKCGIMGNRVVVHDQSGGANLFHFASDNDPKPVLMNRDHILPRSKKGSNSVWNYQTMCVNCNSKKGSVYSDADNIRHLFQAHWRSIHLVMRDFPWVKFPKLGRTPIVARIYGEFKHTFLFYKLTFAIAKLTYKSA